MRFVDQAYSLALFSSFLLPFSLPRSYVVASVIAANVFWLYLVILIVADPICCCSELLSQKEENEREREKEREGHAHDTSVF